MTNEIKKAETQNLASATVISAGFDYEKQIALLTPAQREEYLNLAKAINVKDMTSIQTYGADVTKVVESNGNMLLANVRADQSGEVIAMTNDLLAQLNLIDMDELNSQSKWKRFARKTPILRHLVTSVDNVMIKYDNISTNVDKISNKMKQSKIVAKRDNNTLQIIFDNNVEYIKSIRNLIIAAKLKNEELSSEIEYMISHPEEFEAIDVHDAKSFQNSLEKRIADMETTEYVFNQNLFQIRAIQANNMALSDKADAIVNNVIPIWKNQLALSVIMNNQQANIEAQKKITSTTNKILKKNAELMKVNSINVAKANEEQIISLETLQATTKDLIDTITEVKKIHDDGNKIRKEIEQNLTSYGNQLNNKLMELNNMDGQSVLE